MAQKINPISLRLQYTNRYFDNSWYSKHYYDKLITKDIFIQKYINTFFKLLRLPLGRYSIQHLPKKTRLFTFFCYPNTRENLRSSVYGFPNAFLFYRKMYFKKKKNLNNRKFKKSSLHKKKFLYNKNFWFYQKSVYLGYGIKSKTWHKNFYFLNNLSFTKLNNFGITTDMINSANSTIKTFSSPNKTFRCSASDSQFSMSNILLGKNMDFNDLFLRFILNLVSRNPLKKLNSLPDPKLGTPFQKSQRGTHNLRVESRYQKMKNLEFENLQLKNLLKYILILNNSNIYINKKIHWKLIVKFHTKIVNLLKNKNFRFIDRTTKLQQINKDSQIFTKNGCFWNLALDNNQLNVYSPGKIQTKNILDISNKWKIAKLDNKYKYKNYIQRSLTNIYNLDFEFLPFKVNNDWQSAGFLADEIVYFLEKRIVFRQIKNKLLKKISKNPLIRGIRITCSGRVGGKSKKAQRAKTECVKLGQTSLHVFSNKIDFAVRTAQTSFGSVGIKVWISYN